MTGISDVKADVPISDEAWEAAFMALFAIAGGDSEREVRARRALHDLYDQPFVATPLWNAGQALGWIFCAAILSADADLKARANRIVREALALAAEAQRELRRAA